MSAIKCPQEIQEFATELKNVMSQVVDKYNEKFAQERGEQLHVFEAIIAISLATQVLFLSQFVGARREEATPQGLTSFTPGNEVIS